MTGFVFGQTQTAMFDKRPILAGVGVTAMKSFQQGPHWFTYSYDYSDKVYFGANANFFLITTDNVGFRSSIRYQKWKYTYHTSPDSRHPHNFCGRWLGTNYEYEDDFITVSEYLTFKSASENQWVFAELGPDLEIGTRSVCNVYTTVDDTNCVQTTTLSGTFKSSVPKYGFRFGARVGAVHQIAGPFFLEVAIGIVNIGFKKSNDVLGTTLLANCTVFYNLRWKKTEPE